MTPGCGKIANMLPKPFMLRWTRPLPSIIFPRRPYCGTGMARDYGTFGRIITTLKDKEWFMNYLVKWLWYNSDDGENETDFTVEDELYHYTHRESAA